MAIAAAATPPAKIAAQDTADWLETGAAVSTGVA